MPSAPPVVSLREKPLVALLADGGVAVLVRLECASVLADVLIITYPGSAQVVAALRQKNLEPLMSLYKDVQTADLMSCQDCRAVVTHEEETLHTRWHEDISDALLEHGQLREELSSADLRAAGTGEHCAAAVRAANAASRVHEYRNKSGPGLYDALQELEAALQLWERVR